MKIIFVCHGNICRSPMAEFIMKDIINKNNKKNYQIISRATSFEEIGNDIYPPIKKVLDENNIKYNLHKATRLSKEDCDLADLIIGMDNQNINNIIKICGNNNINKVHKLKEYINDSSDVADPWYTRNFKLCFNEIYNSCNALYSYLEK